MREAKFQIYNASAGSGKTFTLVREYLCILLGSRNKDLFKQILAITFTNKAVNEMKERILESLADFSSPEITEEPTPLFEAVASQLKLPPSELQQRSKLLIHYILHNYSFFDIVTIDKFTHRVIRTFARDLELPQNFEVVIDTEALLKEAIDNLLYQAGTDELLTNTLIQFSLEKADDDKNWDLRRDLYNISKLLLNENDKSFLKDLKTKSLEDFESVLSDIRKESGQLKEQLQALASQTLEDIKNAGIEHQHFKSSYLPKFLINILDWRENINLEPGWLLNIETEPLYAKSSKGNKVVMDELQPMLSEAVLTIKQGVIRYRFLQAIYRNLAPMSLLNAINKELDLIKEEQNLLLISEFNDRIAGAIREQPAPFIYERLGERYKDYFIDEFQDTSAMQWDNLKPLVANALSGESLSGKKGSLMIVGDAKQSIYRWRGGKAEQFIDLYGKEDHNPFPIEKQVVNLPRNFRSFDGIVTFNNEFFAFASQFLNDTAYRELFEKYSRQEVNHKPGGYIRFHFTEKENEDKIHAQLEQCLKTIRELLEQGYRAGDIAILNRNNHYALQVAQHLTDAGIPVISSESLLLQNDRKVRFLVNLIRYAYREEDRENLLELMWFLADARYETEKHGFLSSALETPETVFGEYDFDPAMFRQLPFYNALEYAIRRFELYSGDEAYLQAFLDKVLEFTQKESGSMSDFIEYWEARKHKLSLSPPEESNSVQILTIHKSKGLEFPVVIYPFANTDVYHEVDPKLWINLPENPWNLPHALLNKNKQLESFGQEAAQTLATYQAQQELDTFNVLYVAFTRAVERLYVICEEKTHANGSENTRFLPGIFMQYLKTKDLWEPGKSVVEIGDPQKCFAPSKASTTVNQGIAFTTNEGLLNNYTIITRSGSLWGTGAEISIEKGMLYHDLLAEITFRDDLDHVLEEFLKRGNLSANEMEEARSYLQHLLEHPELREFFTADYTILSEKELMTSAGELLRPDRVMIRDKNAWIIDYKTGSPHARYELQLQKYANALQEMGYQVIQKLLVYIGEEITVQQVS